MKSYMTLLKKKPLTTKMTTTFVLYTLGDMGCQYFEYRQDKRDKRMPETTFEPINSSHILRGDELSLHPILEEFEAAKNVIAVEYSSSFLDYWDAERSSRMGLYGFAISTPLYYAWMCKCLPRIVYFKSKAKCVGMKLFLDQLFFECFMICTFFSSIDLLEGRSASESMENVKEKFLPTFKDSMKVWPAAQLINFALIPLHWQNLWISTVAVFWSAYVSYIQHTE